MNRITTNGKLKNQLKSITTYTCMNPFSSPAKMVVSLLRPEVVNFIGAYTTTFDLLQGAVDHLYFSDLIYVPENRAERGLFDIFTERFVATEKSVSHS